MSAEQQPTGWFCNHGIRRIKCAWCRHQATEATGGTEMSAGTINGEPYSLPDGYEPISREQLHRLQAAAVLLSDMDRCEHGRHLGDVCGGASGCNGPSRGNSFLTTGQRIGTSLHGGAYVVPDFDALRAERRSALALDWMPS